MSTPNPLIPLSVTTATPVTAFQQAQKGQIQNQLLTAQTAGVEERTAGLEEERGAARTKREERALLESRFRNVEAGVKELDPLLNEAIRTKDTTALLEALETRREALLADDTVVDTQDTDLAIQMVTSGQLQGLRTQFDDVLEQGQELDRVTLGLPATRGAEAGAAERFFGSNVAEMNRLTAIPEDQRTVAEQNTLEAINIDLGREARAGTITGAERAALDPDLGAAIADVEGLKSAAKETAKLSAQLKLLPEVKNAVNPAVAQATATADAVKENKSNARALEIYDVAMTGLSGALGNPWTGPFAGLMPAITADQQIADGAVAAMAPVLKQLFRSAGEGIFTDKDQELLLQMVPTRNDRPATIKAKMKNVDAIVRAKLAPIDTGAPATTDGGDKGEGVIMTDAQGNRARVFADGSFEEI